MRSVSKAGFLLSAAGALLIAGAGAASADSSAYGAAFDSPGVLSGNVIQIPVDVPVNICGNSVNVVGALNPAFGNSCSNGGGDQQTAPMHTWHVTGWDHHHGWLLQGWHHEHQDNNADCDGS
ncbi:chaplin [Streptacidiphilus sp. N1-3]|uniref:Chaplin n=1 Tax=Streptacidiphilus alkalitolerans TaxID=3342712 RepID=A0ABV6XA45_9ACTN